MNRALVSLTALLLASCSLAPDYQKPDVATPPAFKEAVAAPTPGEKIADGAWQAAGKDTVVDGAWWKIFKDPQLETLIDEAVKQSPTLEIAAARLAGARAQAGVAEADLFPRLDVGAGPSLQQPSAISVGAPHGTIPKTAGRYRAQGSISYELDLFGANRSASSAADLKAQGEEATYRAVLLALQADVAQATFALRALDREQNILNETQKLREETCNLTRRRLKIGEVSELDVTRAESELAATKADALDVAKRRAEAEHRLAFLLGKSPAALNLAKQPIAGTPPAVPAGLPSALLERRPDIQAAERKMAAANEFIGAARAAFFPSLSLTASGGFESGQLGQLFDWSSRTWMLGPLVGTLATLPIFDGGRNFANLALSKAQYQEAVAGYRSGVLQAFREVEDQLSDLRYLKGQADAQAEGVRAARKAFAIAKTRYENGYISYLDFIDAQRSLLSAERGDAQILGNRYIATVQLIRALGGAWEMNGSMNAGEMAAEKPANDSAGKNGSNPTISAAKKAI